MSQKKQQPHWQQKKQSIECVSCHKKTFSGRFSGNQLDKYRTALLHEQRGGEKAKLPRCVNCTPGNVVELFCSGCRTIKGLDRFSKTQRKNPDEAKCIVCTQAGEDRVPGLAEQMEEEKIRGEAQAAFTVPSVTGSILGSRSQTNSQPRSEDGVYMPEQGGSTWAEEERAPSEAGTVTTTIHSRRSASHNSFAKQGAYRAPAQARKQEQIQREERQKQEAQMGTRIEDSDDDEEWEL